MYTGHALDIVGCITTRDITIGLAWWVPYGSEITMIKKKKPFSFCSKDKHPILFFNSQFRPCLNDLKF